MADVKISGLTAAASANGAMELEVNDAGASKKVTVNQIQDQVVGTTNGLIARTGANTVAARTITAGTNGGIVVSDGNGVAGNPTISNDFASQAEAEAGTVENKAMNPLRVAQAIAALGGSTNKEIFEVTDSSSWTSSPYLTASNADKLFLVTEPYANGQNVLYLDTDAAQPGIAIGTVVDLVTLNGGLICYPSGSGVRIHSDVPEYSVPSGCKGTLTKIGTDEWALRSNARLSNAPFVIETSTFGSGNSPVSYPATALAGRLMLLFMETAAQAPSATPTGFTVLPNLPQTTGTAGSTTATAIYGYYRILDGTERNTTFTPNTSGLDHVAGLILIIDNHYKEQEGDLVYDPFETSAGAVQASATTAVSMPTITTTLQDCLVLQVLATATDGTNFISSVTNSGLRMLNDSAASVATTTGNGGNIRVMSGLKRSAGALAATTGTLGSSSVQAKYTLAISPR